MVNSTSTFPAPSFVPYRDPAAAIIASNKPVFVLRNISNLPAPPPSAPRRRRRSPPARDENRPLSFIVTAPLARRNAVRRTDDADLLAQLEHTAALVPTGVPADPPAFPFTTPAAPAPAPASSLTRRNAMRRPRN